MIARTHRIVYAEGGKNMEPQIYLLTVCMVPLCRRSKEVIRQYFLEASKTEGKNEGLRHRKRLKFNMILSGRLTLNIPLPYLHFLSFLQ